MSAANVDADDRRHDIDVSPHPTPIDNNDIDNNNDIDIDIDDASTCCPICLDRMSRGDIVHPITCPTYGCTYNFCLDCTSKLIVSSKDDYCIASDGSRRVKVKLVCPSCRSDISGGIYETISNRERMLVEELGHDDSELSAGELRMKHRHYFSSRSHGGGSDNSSHRVGGRGGNAVRGESGGGDDDDDDDGSDVDIVDTTLLGGLDFAMSEQERKFVTGLMISGRPELLCRAATILGGIAALLREGGGGRRTVVAAVVVPPPSRSSATGPGTTTTTGGGGRGLGAAAANAGRTAAVLRRRDVDTRSGYSNAGIRTNRSSESENNGGRGGMSDFQREMEGRARERLRRPLPARMPLCVSLGTGEFESLFIKLREQQEQQQENAAALEEEEEDRRLPSSPPPPQDRPSWGEWLGRAAGSLGIGMVMGGGGGGGGRPMMTFVDDEWDGTIADAFARARVGRGSVGGGGGGGGVMGGGRGGGDRRPPTIVVRGRAGPKDGPEREGVERVLNAAASSVAGGGGGGGGGRDYNDVPNKSNNNGGPFRSRRVLVGSVRGRAGKSGIMKGDVVTHVDGEAFTGNASELNALLARAYEENGRDGVVTIVVNAEECTAEALRLRSLVR